MPILPDEDLRQLEIFIRRGGDMFNPGFQDGRGAETNGAEVVDYREYDINEDDGLSIDPYMTALHGGQPWVREFAPDRLRRASLVVDQDSTMYAGDKLRAAHEVTYALGHALNRQGDLSALYVSGTAQPWTEMSRESNHIGQFDGLLSQTPVASRSTLPHTLQRVAYNDQSQDMVFVVASGMSNNFRDAVSVLSGNSFEVVVMQILHREDTKMNDRGRYGNPQESRVRVTSNRTSVREQWTASATAYQAETSALLARLGFGHIVIDPAQPTVRQLIAAFSHQEVYA
jgi:uncharacterized protein (DUF58 family)